MLFTIKQIIVLCFIVLAFLMLYWHTLNQQEQEKTEILKAAEDRVTAAEDKANQQLEQLAKEKQQLERKWLALEAKQREVLAIKQQAEQMVLNAQKQAQAAIAHAQDADRRRQHCFNTAERYKRKIQKLKTQLAERV